METPKKYSVDYRCWNCDYLFAKSFIVEQEAPPYVTCEKCGCLKAYKERARDYKPAPWIPPSPQKRPLNPWIPWRPVPGPCDPPYRPWTPWWKIPYKDPRIRYDTITKDSTGKAEQA